MTLDVSGSGTRMKGDRTGSRHVAPEILSRCGRALRQDVEVNWLRRPRRFRHPANPDPRPRLAAVRAAASEAAGRGGEALERLVDVLTELDAASDDDLGRAALGVVGEQPNLVIRLDELARRMWRYSPALNRSAARLAQGPAGPITVALAITYHDGRVRDRAVAAMLDRPCPELMPFLVLRAGDWVAQVRDRARAGLALLLAADPGTYLPAALPTIVWVQPRLRGGFAYAQALAALVTAPAELHGTLADGTDRRQRRFVFETALALGRLGLDDLVAAAESDDDPWIRVRTAEAACREAVWTRRVTTLRRLARSRRADVRVVALTGLARIGHDTDVVGHLDDDAPLVRAVARDAARRLGADALAHYRAAMAGPAPAAGAVAGLAETGTAADAALLRPLLAHAAGSVRAQAVRAVRELDAVDVDEMIPLLRDPSPAVVRETTAALRPFTRRVPPELAWQLLADARVELRRAGYRLLRDRDTALHLRAALLLAVDPDPALAERGRADLTRLARDANQPARRRTAPPELRVTAGELVELTGLAHQTVDALPDDTTGLLATWLARTVPTDRTAP
jgi:hypothetical protein